MEQIKQLMDGVAFAMIFIAYFFATPHICGLKLPRFVKFLKTPIVIVYLASGFYAAARIINLIKTNY